MDTDSLTPLRPPTSSCPHEVCHLGSACAFHSRPAALRIARPPGGPRAATGVRPVASGGGRISHPARPHVALTALSKLENFIRDLIRQEASLESTVRNVKATSVQSAAQSQLTTVQSMLAEVQNAVAAINATTTEYRAILNE